MNYEFHDSNSRKMTKSELEDICPQAKTQSPWVESNFAPSHERTMDLAHSLGIGTQPQHDCFDNLDDDLLSKSTLKKIEPFVREYTMFKRESDSLDEFFTSVFNEVQIMECRIISAHATVEPCVSITIKYQNFS